MAKKAGRTIGVISDDIYKIKLEEEKLRKQMEGLESKRKVLEAELYTAAEKQGLEKGGGKTSSFTIADHTVPSVEDWDTYWDFIAKTRFFHLVQRRPAVKACQEMWEMGKVIPGVTKFSSKKVTVKGV
jgi:hypothetical protein